VRRNPQSKISNTKGGIVTQFAFFKGQIVPIEDAKISIMTHAFNYGTGCFEGIRAYRNEDEKQLFVFQLIEHYERFLRSSRILWMNLPFTAERLAEITVELVRKEGYHEDTYIRPLAFKSDEIIGVRLHNLHDEVGIFATPFGRYLESEEGARVGVSSWRRIDDNSVPARAKITGAYINSALAKTEAALNGFDEAIVLTEDGHVSEGSAENLFIVRDRVLITPPVTENILEGITRKVIIELARKELGLEVMERSIDRTELYVAEEVFFCGTGVQVAAVAQIDHRTIGTGQIGPIVKALRDLYFQVVRGQVSKYRAWCTPVYAV
jgi:branched-chain amino acid aminotransferase